MTEQNRRPIFCVGPSFSSTRILCFVRVEPELVDLAFEFDGSLVLFGDLAVEPELADLGFDGSLANASNNKATAPSPSESE